MNAQWWGPHGFDTEAVECDLRMLCINNRLRDGLVAAGMNEGWGQSFEKLDALLERA